MPSPTHEAMVASQFGPRAEAYASSAVHAQGEDLRQIAEAAEARRPARALDLGCGAGHAAFCIAPHAGEVVAYDLSPEMLAVVARGAAERGLAHVVTRQGAVEALPFERASFDLVVTRYSAHHWHDLAAGLREARRVLAPGGRMVVSDLASPGPGPRDTFLQAIELLRDPSHVRNLSCDEWTRALREAGFSPGAPVRRRLRLEFASWVGRMRTPAVHVEAIRSLQAGASRDVAEHFVLEPDGSFTAETATIEATAA